MRVPHGALRRARPLHPRCGAHTLPAHAARQIARAKKQAMTKARVAAKIEIEKRERIAATTIQAFARRMLATRFVKARLADRAAAVSEAAEAAAAAAEHMVMVAAAAEEAEAAKAKAAAATAAAKYNEGLACKARDAAAAVADPLAGGRSGASTEEFERVSDRARDLAKAAAAAAAEAAEASATAASESEVVAALAEEARGAAEEAAAALLTAEAAVPRAPRESSAAADALAAASSVAAADAAADAAAMAAADAAALAASAEADAKRAAEAVEVAEATSQAAVERAIRKKHGDLALATGVKLQKYVRRYRARKQAEREQALRVKMARRLQAFFRWKKAIAALLAYNAALKKAAIVVQTLRRGQLARRLYAYEKRRRHDLLVHIQATWRGAIVRRKFREVLTAARIDRMRARLIHATVTVAVEKVLADVRAAYKKAMAKGRMKKFKKSTMITAKIKSESNDAALVRAAESRAK